MMDLSSFLYKKNKSLDDYETDLDLGKKSELKIDLLDYTRKIAEFQDALYAESKQSLLIVMQGMDAAGKDSAIRAIFSGVNPAGIFVHGFKAPSKEEYAHDYLWRHYKKLPPKGFITIFNRSHYENVLVTKVHPEYILSENLKEYQTIKDIDDTFWAHRYEQINSFEKTQTQTGTHIVKFMLHVSQKEQHKRFLNRIENEEDNWKFSAGDWRESQLWPQYQSAYQDMLEATSTDHAPWHVIPCDDKPSARIIMAEILMDKINKMNPQYPNIDPDDLDMSKEVRQIILKEQKD